MCGIIGLISKRTSGLPFYVADVFSHMLVADSIRGEDSTGVFGIHKDGIIDWAKGNCDGGIFIKSSDYAKFKSRIFSDYQFVVGHNRKATRGSIKPENAHPFKVDNIILVHNGTIHNADSLKKDVDVDSHAICHALAEHNAPKALEKINGAYALVWYDSKDKTLNLARNTERPLHLIEYEEHWAISSEMGLAIWAHGREGKQYKKVLPVPTDKILQVKLDELEKDFVEIPYEKYTYKATQTSWPTAGITERAKTSNFGNNNKLVDVKFNTPASKDLNIKTGEKIRFLKDDLRMDPDVRGMVLFGKLFVDKNEVDDNIIVRAYLPSPVDMEYFKSSLEWEAEVTSVRNYDMIPVVYVRNPSPVLYVEDKQGTKLQKKELPLKLICAKCHGTVEEKDIPQSIVRHNQDDSWRIVCSSCIDTAVKNAQTPTLELVHSVH